MRSSGEVDWTGLSLLDTWFPYLLKQARCLICPMVIRQFRVNFHSRAIFPLVERHYWLAPFVSLSISCTRFMKHAPEFLVPVLFCNWRLMRWVVTRATTSTRPILMRTMATTETLVMCLLIVTSTFMPEFVETKMPFSSYTVQLASSYLRTLPASLAWPSRTKLLLWSANVR